MMRVVVVSCTCKQFNVSFEMLSDFPKINFEKSANSFLVKASKAVVEHSSCQLIVYILKTTNKEVRGHKNTFLTFDLRPKCGKPS